jgi:hypothetical protein
MHHRFRRPPGGIKDIDGLHEHLQTALVLELSTIPPYLCALYSIKDGCNDEAARVIKSVAMEEMLHMALVANVLNALGGRPCLDRPEEVPTYPARLPHSAGTFEVRLRKFSPEAVDTFLKIERPAAPGAPAQADNYDTIGQFYKAVEDGLRRVCRGDRYFVPDRHRRQVTAEYFYGGGGAVAPVTDLRSALAALAEIVHQGEGLPHAVSDGDDRLFHDPREYAHYFRFKEIAEGRRYARHDTPQSGPTGDRFPVDWGAVYDMRTDPRAADYPPGSELRRKSEEFNRAYTGLVHTLHRCFNGEPQLLVESVGAMYDLKYRAIALMRVPRDDGTAAGPTFEYAAPEGRYV